MSSTSISVYPLKFITHIKDPSEISKPKEKKNQPKKEIDEESESFETEFAYEDLPPHLVVDIFQYLPKKDLLKVGGKVCSEWRKSFQHPFLWKEYTNKLYKEIYELELENFLKSPSIALRNIRYESDTSENGEDHESDSSDDTEHEEIMNGNEKFPKMVKITGPPRLKKIKKFDRKSYYKCRVALTKLKNLKTIKKERERIIKCKVKERVVKRKLKKVNLLVYVALTIMFYALFSFYVYFLGIKFFLEKLFSFYQIVFIFPGLLLILIVLGLSYLFIHCISNLYIKQWWPWKNKLWIHLKALSLTSFFISLMAVLAVSFLSFTYLFGKIPFMAIGLSVAFFVINFFGFFSYYHFKYLKLNYFNLSTKTWCWHIFFASSLIVCQISYLLLSLTVWIPFQFPITYYKYGLNWWYFLPFSFFADLLLFFVLMISKKMVDGLRLSIYLNFVNYGVGILGLFVCKALFIVYSVVGNWIFFAFLAPITSVASSTLYLILSHYYT